MAHDRKSAAILVSPCNSLQAMEDPWAVNKGTELGRKCILSSIIIQQHIIKGSSAGKKYENCIGL